MKKAGDTERVQPQSQAVNPGRRMVLQGMLALGGAMALGKFATAAQTFANGGNVRLKGGRISVRWLGGGVAELATPDYKQIAYCDAWIWNNTGWSRFSVENRPSTLQRQGSSSTSPARSRMRCSCYSRTTTAIIWATISRC